MKSSKCPSINVTRRPAARSEIPAEEAACRDRAHRLIVATNYLPSVGRLAVATAAAP
jgi:hypothetical protein